ncbi:hypothetical protein WR25_08759 isoform D [Diploscapter pachys]|uniref:Armadillo segment polarity protein n=1 Tax=Diploscapter pachys TaxID=2018661 RepID=A0A2A2KJG6_9BILA|nr:hypothetical protein WR25_08759 isoform D [Diploscapter pachys]
MEDSPMGIQQQQQQGSFPTNINPSEVALLPSGNMPSGLSGGSTASANFKVSMWQNRNFDSGVQTMLHSQNPSVMSTMTSLHAPSHMSELSVSEVDAGELTHQQQQKFENISFCAANAVDFASAERALPELVALMRDPDDAVVWKAIYIIQRIAKMNAEMKQPRCIIQGTSLIPALNEVLQTKSASGRIVGVALSTLFHICSRNEGLASVIQLAHSDTHLLLELVKHINTAQHACYRYSLLTLHSILTERQHGIQSLEFVRQAGALTAVSRWLDHEKHEKLLSVMIDLVRLLCDKNPEQRSKFFDQSGIIKLLHIIDTCQYEHLLWRTTQLLKSFANYNAEWVVRAGGRRVLPRLMMHASPKLVHSALECLRNMSDVPSNGDDSEMLYACLQLMGSSNPVTTLYTAQIISNQCANNRINKEFLVKNNAVHSLIRVLAQCSTGSAVNSSDEQQILEELEEGVLSALRQLCNGHSLEDRAQQEVMQVADHLLATLVNMRPLLIRQTLSILWKSARQSSNLPIFRDLRMERPAMAGPSVGFVEQIVHILQVSCSQLPQTLIVENVKLSDLMVYSMNTLQLLASDRGLLQQVVYFLQQSDFISPEGLSNLLPVFVLQQSVIEDATLKKSALSFINSIVCHPEMAAYFGHSQELMNLLKRYARHSNQDIVRLSESACRTVMLGGEAPRNHVPPLPLQQHQQQQQLPYQYAGKHPSTPNRQQVQAGNIYTSASSSAQPSSAPSPLPMNYDAIEGAGEQWSKDFNSTNLMDDPFASSYASSLCNSGQSQMIMPQDAANLNTEGNYSKKE